MPTPTCVMCHADVESVDHLFTLCPFASLIWSHFGQLFGLRESPYSLTELWGNWRSSISKSIRVCWDMLIRAIIWNIWLERNARIFNFTCASSNSIVAKIVHMVLLWFNAVPDSKRAKLEEPMQKIKRSLEFHITREAISVPPEPPVTPNAP